MCGRYSQTNLLEFLKVRFGLHADNLNVSPRFNIAPGQFCPVVVVEGGRRVLKDMRWGLIPFWAKDESIGYRTINARSETVDSKPAFRKAFTERRCLVPADGFYEWRAEKGSRKKVPMRFVLRSREPFAFAGLWESWRDPGGNDLLSFTILTTESNALIRPFHERMPVILHPEDEEAFLDPRERDPGRLKAFLAPFPADEMEYYDVSSVVNAARNETPECVEPAAPEDSPGESE